MSRPILGAILASAAVAAVLYAGATFVTPRGSSTPLPPQKQLRSVQPPTPFEEPSVAAEEASPSFTKWVGAGLLAGLIAATSSMAPAFAKEAAKEAAKDPMAKVMSTPVQAPPGRDLSKGAWAVNIAKKRESQGYIKGWQAKYWKSLEPCKTSKKYKKLFKDQLFKLTSQQKKYPQGSLQYERFADRIAGEKRRQEAYGERYCTIIDGRPQVIPTGELTKGSIVAPTLMFFYITGWIGWSGRRYLQLTQDPMKELMIDVPLFLQCMASGFAWPVLAWQDIVNGKFVAKESEHRGTGASHWSAAPGY